VVIYEGAVEAAVPSPFVTSPDVAKSSPSRSVAGASAQVHRADALTGTVLVVEDEPTVADVLATTLRACGYTIEVAATGYEALDLVSLFEPDVVLLDLWLPDVDGIEVCRRLRRWFLNPILVVTAESDEDRKVAALDAGADDYLTKPFSMRELLARLRVALRHRRVLAEVYGSSPMRVGNLEIDPDAHTATMGGVPLKLARKEFALLVLLARNSGRVLTYQRLLSQVWGTSDLALTERLRVQVAQLRRKLGERPGHPRILNQAGVGYRMVDPDP
jgi:two-component system KDP operon response regulator KdpE